MKWGVVVQPARWLLLSNWLLCGSALHRDLFTVWIGLGKHAGWATAGGELGCLGWKSFGAVQLFALQTLMQRWLWQRAIGLSVVSISSFLLMCLYTYKQSATSHCHTSIQPVLQLAKLLLQLLNEGSAMQQRKLQMPNKFPQKVSISRKTSANTGSRYTWKTVSTSQSGNLRLQLRIGPTRKQS